MRYRIEGKYVVSVSAKEYLIHILNLSLWKFNEILRRIRLRCSK